MTFSHHQVTVAFIQVGITFRNFTVRNYLSKVTKGIFFNFFSVTVTHSDTDLGLLQIQDAALSDNS